MKHMAECCCIRLSMTWEDLLQHFKTASHLVKEIRYWNSAECIDLSKFISPFSLLNRCHWASCICSRRTATSGSCYARRNSTPVDRHLLYFRCRLATFDPPKNFRWRSWIELDNWKPLVAEVNNSSCAAIALFFKESLADTELLMTFKAQSMHIAWLMSIKIAWF